MYHVVHSVRKCSNGSKKVCIFLERLALKEHFYTKLKLIRWMMTTIWPFEEVILYLLCVNERCYFSMHIATLERTEQFSGNFSFQCSPYRKKNFNMGPFIKGTSYGNILAIW